MAGSLGQLPPSHQPRRFGGHLPARAPGRHRDGGGFARLSAENARLPGTRPRPVHLGGGAYRGVAGREQRDFAAGDDERRALVDCAGRGAYHCAGFPAPAPPLWHGRCHPCHPLCRVESLRDWLFAPTPPRRLRGWLHLSGAAALFVVAIYRTAARRSVRFGLRHGAGVAYENARHLPCAHGRAADCA